MNKDKKEQLGEKILTTVVGEFAKWILSLISSSGVLVAILIFLRDIFFQKISTLVFICILIGVFVALGTVFLVYWRYKFNKANRDRPVYPNLGSNYELSKATKNLVFYQDEKIKYFSEYEYISLIDDLDEINLRYFWTGSNKLAFINIYIDNGMDLNVNVLDEKVGIWTIIKILIKNPIKKGDNIKFRLEFDLGSSRNNEYKPFLAAIIDEPTEELTLIVTFPQHIKREDLGLSWETFFHDRIDKPISSGKDIRQTRGAYGDISYSKTFKKPKLLYNYKLKWDKPTF